MSRAIVAAAAVALIITIYVFSGRKPSPSTLACPLPAQEVSQHANMVWVPPATFNMGSEVYPEEAPRRTVTVQGFWMDRTEVTNADFAEFVRATNYVTTAERPATLGSAVFTPPAGSADLTGIASWWRLDENANWKHPGGPDTSIDGREHFPVVAVTLEDAKAYAKWKGRELPTEAQWERAAQTTAPQHVQPKDANTWQGVFPIINTNEDGFEVAAPVGCFQANALGLHDMLGNVWELTVDDYPGRSTASHVIKGGSYLCAPNYCMRYRPAARQAQEANLGSNHVGFRTILNAPGPSE